MGINNSIIKLMKHLTTVLAFYFLQLSCANAEVTEYDFEIIIFEDIANRYANSEQWQYEFDQTASDSTLVEMDSQGNRANTTSSSSASNIRQIKGIGLNKYVRKLASSKNYHVLVHKSWRQTGLADDAAIDIPIDSRLTDKGNANYINGTIKIVLGRYLHIYTDMIYQQPRKEAAPLLIGETSQHYKRYPINFHRRMRSKELHYLDHPIVGILVMEKKKKKQEGANEKS